jgi:hypothetical protein
MLSHLRVHALRDSNSRFVLGLSPVKQFRRFIGLDKKKKSDGADSADSGASKKGSRGKK